MEYFLSIMFSGFWCFLGCWLLLGLVCNFIIQMARVIRGVPIKITQNFSTKDK